MSAWRALLDVRRLDATAPAWLTASELLIAQHREESARIAAEYHVDFRAAELAALGIEAPPPPAVEPTDADPDAVRTSLLVTGPVAVKRATADGVPLAEAARLGEVRAEAAAARHVLNGGRDIIRRTAERDRLALGWARVTDGDPCWLCAMQASRGPVFKSKRSALLKPDGQIYHDGCNCSAEPVYSKGAEWPGTGRDWQALWNDVARGKSPEDARRAFRQAVDAQSGTSSPEARRERRAQRRAEEAAANPPPADSSATEPDNEPTTEPQSPEPDSPAPDAAPDPLDGVDLAALDDDALYELFAEHGDNPPALERILAELESRDEPAADEASANEPDPLDGVDLAGLSQAWLEKLLRDHADRPDVVDRLIAEAKRRDTARAEQAAEPAPWEQPDELPPDDDLTPEQRRVEQLVADGWSWEDAYAEVHDLDPEELERQRLAAEVDDQRQAGETREEAVRRLYREYVAVQYLAAETATRGHLLSRAGQAEGIDPESLFSGPTARARKYGSEDLLRWFAEHGRMTYTEYRAQLLGRDADKKAAATTRLQSNAQDFI